MSREGEKERQWTISVCNRCGHRVRQFGCACPEAPEMESVEVAEVSALSEVEAEREELLRQIQADHKAMAAIGGRSCCCKWCEQESPLAAIDPSEGEAIDDSANSGSANP